MSSMNTNLLTHEREPVLKFPLLILKWLVGLIQRYFWRCLLKIFTSPKIKLNRFTSSMMLQIQSFWCWCLGMYVWVRFGGGGFVFIYLFIPSRSPPGPLCFRANQEGLGKCCSHLEYTTCHWIILTTFPIQKNWCSL